MIELIFAIFTALSSSSFDTDGEALRRTVRNHAGDPVHGADARPFSHEEAVEHVVYANVATVIVDMETNERIDADDLLGVAWHESRYDPAVSTNEGPGMWYADNGAGPGAYSPIRWTCGVMTPNSVPRKCMAHELQIGNGYLAGARHLAVWRKQCRARGLTNDEQIRVCALNGYAGGADDGQVRGYKTWQVFAWRAAWIKRERLRSAPGV